LIIFLFVGTFFVTIWAFFLPKVEHSLYFHTKEYTENIQLHQSDNKVIAIPENATVCYFEKLYYYNGSRL